MSDLLLIFFTVAIVDEEAAATITVEKVTERRQLFVLEQLFSIGRGFVVAQKEELIRSVLEFLFFQAFYSFKGKKADKEVPYVLFLFLFIL